MSYRYFFAIYSFLDQEYRRHGRDGHGLCKARIWVHAKLRIHLKSFFTSVDNLEMRFKQSKMILSQLVQLIPLRKKDFCFWQKGKLTKWLGAIFNKTLKRVGIFFLYLKIHFWFGSTHFGQTPFFRKTPYQHTLDQYKLDQQAFDQHTLGQ